MVVIIRNEGWAGPGLIEQRLYDNPETSNFSVYLIKDKKMAF